MSQLKPAIWHCEEEKGKTWLASACFSCTLKESSCSPSYNLASPRIWIHYLSTLRSLPISTLFPSFTHLLMHLILRTKNPAVIHDHWTMNAISEMSVKISIQSLKQLQVAALLSGNSLSWPTATLSQLSHKTDTGSKQKAHTLTTKTKRLPEDYSSYSKLLRLLQQTLRTNFDNSKAHTRKPTEEYFGDQGGRILQDFYKIFQSI